MAPGQGVNQAAPKSAVVVAGTAEFPLCVEESARQLHLSILWFKYRAGLTSLRDQQKNKDAGKLADDLYQKIIAPFGDAHWLPGVDKLAIEIKADLGRYRATDWTKAVENLRGQLLAYVERSLQSGRLPNATGLKEIFDHFQKDPEGEGKAPPSPGKGEAIQHEPSLTPKYWVREAEALVAWFRLVPALEGLERVFDLGGRLDKEINRAERLAAGIEPLQAQLARDIRALKRNLEVAKQAVQMSPRGGAGLMEWVGRFHWQETYASTPDDWPPRALVDLADAFHRITGRDDRWMKKIVPPPEAATLPPREALALGVLDALDAADQAGPLPAGVWDEAGRQIGRFLGVEVIVIRRQEFPADSTRSDWREVHATGHSWTLRKTGLARVGPPDRLIRPAEFEAPPETASSLNEPLQELRDAAKSGRLGTLAKQLLAELPKSADLKPNQISETVFPILWEILSRAHIARKTPAAAVLIRELDRLGYRLASPGPGSATPLPPGWVLIVPDGATTGRPQSPELIALQVPGGRLVLPSVLVQVPHPWLASEPWIKVLHDHEAILPGLVFPGPDYSRPADWAKETGLADLLINFLAARTPSCSSATPPDTGTDRAVELFLAFYDASKRPGIKDRERLHLIARDLYATLPDPRAALGIPLRAKDLGVDLAALAREGGTRDLAMMWEPAPGKGSETEIVDWQPARPGRSASLRLRRRRGVCPKSWPGPCSLP